MILENSQAPAILGAPRGFGFSAFRIKGLLLRVAKFLMNFTQTSIPKSLKAQAIPSNMRGANFRALGFRALASILGGVMAT